MKSLSLNEGAGFLVKVISYQFLIISEGGPASNRKRALFNFIQISKRKLQENPLQLPFIMFTPVGTVEAIVPPSACAQYN